MKKLLRIVVVGLLLQGCATTQYIEATKYSEFIKKASAEGYKYFARAQRTNTVTADGLGDDIAVDGKRAGAHTDSQDYANQVALNACGYSDCVITMEGNSLTSNAKALIAEAKLIAQKRIAEKKRKKKEEEKKIAEKEKQKPKPGPDENVKISGASGTAFFIDNNGHLITNHHVIDGCKDKSQISYKNENVKAKLIAKDNFLDLALLKADVKNSNFINISTTPPKKLKRVIVAGYPFGLELSDDLKFNSGIITSLKGLGDDSTRIQIDAAVNPGNSGGPIVYEENGELVAVAVAGLSKDKTEAVNFGIKASSVENFLQSNQIDLTLVEQKFNFSNDDLSELLESSTVYTFCK